jgi:hypothetical protein
MEQLRQLREYYQTVGLLRFSIIMLAIIALIFGYASLIWWLSEKTGWREAYGFRCNRKCWLTDLYHSPALLRQGGLYELAFFATLWLIPLTVSVTIIWVRCRKWMNKRQNRIRAMD